MFANLFISGLEEITDSYSFQMDLKKDAAIKQKEESNIKLDLMIEASMKIMIPNRNSEPYQYVCVYVCVLNQMTS